MKNFRILIIGVFFVSFIFISGLSATEPLIIGVENKDWFPHYYWKNDTLDGLDIQIIVAVFDRLNIDFEFKTFPWKRLIKQIEWKKIDGGVDLSYSKEREKFVYYPQEYLTEEGKAFYVKKGSSFKFSGNLTDVKVQRIALMRGYNWSDELIKMGNPPVYRADEYSQVFRMLAFERIEVFGGHVLSTPFQIKKLGYSGKLTMVNPPIKIQKHYLGFAKKQHLEPLVKKFSDELKKFKKTNQYRFILKSFSAD